MRSHRNSLVVLALAGLVFTGSGFAASPTSAHLAPPNAPKSEFSFRPGFGKDPFFPRSTANLPVAPVAPEDPGTVVQSTVPNFIALKGISITKSAKLAIINNYTVGEGEVFTVKNAGKLFSLRCVEIKETSVVVELDGATKELPLRIK